MWPYLCAGFVFCMNMLIWDVWTELVTQMCINLGQAFVAILVCCSIFLLHPLAAAIVCLNVLAVQFELMGPSSRTITSWSVLASTLNATGQSWFTLSLR